MRNFILGFFIGIILLLLAGYGFLKWGAYSMAADSSPDFLERLVAGNLLQGWLDAAPDTTNPLQVDEANLAAGRGLYEKHHCVECHGGLQGEASELGTEMHPAAPQFSRHPPRDLTDGQVFRIIQKGIKMTGMPGMDDLSEDEIWKLVLLLKNSRPADQTEGGTGHE